VTTDPSDELPVVLAQERLAHPNPHTCAHCTINRATLRLTLADENQVTVCRPHAARYPRPTIPASDHPATTTPATVAERESRPAPAAIGSLRPDGPGRIAVGQRVTCLPGSLPARDGGRGGGVLVSIGPKTSVVDVYCGTRRRIRNELLHPEAGPYIAADREARGLRTTAASGRSWLLAWSWLGWTIAEHLEYQQGTRHLPTPPAAPQRLVIVACGSRKAACLEASAGEMYVGSYHLAARRAAEAIATPGTRVMILSAWYGLLDPADQILRYEMRLGRRGAISAQGLREQAEQLGLLATTDVVVLAPAAYADLAIQMWPHAHQTLAGIRGIGDQMARFAALATGRTTLADLTSPQADTAGRTAEGDTTRQIVSARGAGLVHLVTRPRGPAGVAVPACPAGKRSGAHWQMTGAAITCTRCTAIVARRRALERWCAMIHRIPAVTGVRPAPRSGSNTTPSNRPSDAVTDLSVSGSGWCQAGGCEEPVDQVGLVLHAFESVLGDPDQVVDSAGGEVGHAAFEVGPDVLGRVQLRGVAR